MGKYRILLVLFSFLVIYSDVYVNKQESSFIVSTTIFVAMLLYDYEKMSKNANSVYATIVSRLGAYVFSILTFVFISFMVISIYDQIKFEESNAFLFNLDILIFSFPPIGVGIPFSILFLVVFTLTLLEVFCESEPKSISKALETSNATETAATKE